MANLILSALLILVCSGCSGLTLGPTVEKKAIIVKAGTPIEVIEQVSVTGRLVKQDDGVGDEFQQDIGGWIMMHPDHWDSLQNQFKQIQQAYMELQKRLQPTPAEQE